MKGKGAGLQADSYNRLRVLAPGWDFEFDLGPWPAKPESLKSSRVEEIPTNILEDLR
jgi:hypothetical protein